MRKVSKKFYICPVEGVVTKKQPYTHIYRVSLSNTYLAMHIINVKYMTDTPISFNIVLHISSVVRLLTWGREHGFEVVEPYESIEEMCSGVINPGFMETIHHLYWKREESGITNK